jgi:2-hydroxychromene-2-carboxylate isomerase
MDARRFANKQGLTLKGPKKVYYARPANAGMLYAQRHGAFRRYNDLAFDRFWRRELDPESVDAVAALLGEAGAPPGFASFDGRGRRRARSPAQRGRASGIFGADLVFEGELFWGGDRIGLLRERLGEKGVKRRPA